MTSMLKVVPLALIAMLSSPVLAADNELAQLTAEDQAVRTGNNDPRSDDLRRKRVLEILAMGGVMSPRDKFNAALVLQHTGLVYCDGQIKSASAENYLLAHYLFKEAMAGGVEAAKYLVAASIDRYLSFTAGYQWYGTNRLIDQETGKEVLVPVDRKITDAERAIYGIPPLEVLLRKYPEKASGG